MSKRTFLMFVLMVLGSFALSACQKETFECTDRIGCVTVEPDMPIHIGVLQVQSGELAWIGFEQLHAIELALDLQEQQLLGHTIALHIEDSLCSPEGGSVAAAKVAAVPDLVGIIGTTCSGSAVTAAKIVSDAGLVMISGGNSASSLTSVGGEQGEDWQVGYFRTIYNDALRGQAAARFVTQVLEVSYAATVDDGDPYTRGLAQAFAKVFAELGGEVVLEARINKGDRDMGPVLSAIASRDVAFVFMPLLPPEAEFMIDQARKTPGFEHVVLMGADLLLVNKFIELSRVDVAGVYFVHVAPLVSEEVAAIKALYISRYGEPDTLAYALTYDAVNVLFAAIERVAVQDKDGTVHIGRQALRDALYATRDFEGVTGRLTCDSFGDCSAPHFNVVRLDETDAQRLKSTVVYTYTPGQ